MSVRMRHTRGHTGNRRSHHGLKEPRLSTCSGCGAEHKRHTVCMNCGSYRGRQVIDVKAIRERKEARKEAKLRRMGEEVDKQDETTTAQEPDSLDPTELSKKE